MELVTVTTLLTTNKIPFYRVTEGVRGYNEIRNNTIDISLLLSDPKV